MTAAPPVVRPPRAVHWARRPLPEPPRTRRLAKSVAAPVDRLGALLEEWLAEQRIRYTFDGE